MSQITSDPHIGGLNTDRSRKSSDHHALFDGDGSKYGSKSLNGYKRGIRGELLKRALSNPSSAKSKLPDELLEEDYALFGWLDCSQHVSGKNGWTKVATLHLSISFDHACQKFFAIDNMGVMWMGANENMAEMKKVDLETSMIHEVFESENPLVFQVSDKRIRSTELTLCYLPLLSLSSQPVLIEISRIGLKSRLYEPHRRNLRVPRGRLSAFYDAMAPADDGPSSLSSLLAVLLVPYTSSQLPVAHKDTADRSVHSISSRCLLPIAILTRSSGWFASFLSPPHLHMTIGPYGGSVLKPPMAEPGAFRDGGSGQEDQTDNKDGCEADQTDLLPVPASILHVMLSLRTDVPLGML
eukprot:751736-Hanusia_phi.AAC.1